MKRTWSDQELEILRKHYSTSTKDEMAKILPTHSYYSIKSKALFLKLKKTEETMLRIYKSYNQNWTFEMDDFIVKNYSNMIFDDIAKHLNVSKPAIKNRVVKLGLKGKKNIGCFNKGDAPKNKGQKWDDYLTKETQQRIIKTCFKKGHTPANHRNVGSVRKQADGYWYIKISDPRTWKPLHHIIYQEYNPEFRFGEYDVLEFKDGNKDNLHVENLFLTTRQESIKRSSNSNEGIVRYITRDKDIQNFILKHYPHLIDAKRNSINLKKSLKNLHNGNNN